MSDGTDWCRHYHGVGKTCEAGVDPQSVRVDVRKTPSGRSVLYPCFETDRVAHACPQCSYLTPEERQAQKDASAAAFMKYLTDLANNICPFCGAVVAKRVQVGRCVYAEPCNHRLYQGKV